MSRHPSFGKAYGKGIKRNVLKRYERLDALKKLGRFDANEKKRITGFMLQAGRVKNLRFQKLTE